MSLHATLSPLLFTSTTFLPLHLQKKCPNIKLHVSIHCVSGTLASTTTDLKTTRRSANYPSSVWDYDVLQSLGDSNYSDERYKRHIERLKDEVKKCLSNREMEPLAKLELIDDIQNLGLKYHFEIEIKNALNILFLNANDGSLADDDDLYASTLQFRLFRQNGYDASIDVFKRFKDAIGKFKESLCKDVKGLLSMYEASFLGFEGESLIDEAKAFSKKHLKGSITAGSSLARKVEHALDMPLHWRLNRMEATWFIDTYEQEHDMNPTLLQLAKLDFNVLQSIHQKEVAKLARWWKDMELSKVWFARDRLVEHYFWCCGVIFEPEFGFCREMETKLLCAIILVDDTYDVFGSLEELDLFTDFVERWNITEIDKLPDPLKLCFLAMYNTSNEIGYRILKDKGFNIIPFLCKEWSDLCKAYLQEAKWYSKGHKPAFEDYLENAAISVGLRLMLLGCYFLSANKIMEDALNYIQKFPTIIRSPSLIVRLANDLATSSDEMARGDSIKSVECYMNKTRVSEEIARQHIHDLLHKNWKMINKAMLGEYPFSESFLRIILECCKIAQFFYLNGDREGALNKETKDLLVPLLLQPIPLEELTD